MMIPVIADYYLSRDKRQWILMRRTAKKGDKKKAIGKVKASGVHTEDQFAPEGFFYSLPQVASSIVNRCEEIEAEDFAELLDAYENLITQLAEYMEAEYGEVK